MIMTNDNTGCGEIPSLVFKAKKERTILVTKFFYIFNV